ncbi:MAG: hypothetical protein K0Q68_802 [Moraxellaceae bacterium]|jgi:hypothetical protein|nr:hypothetical protein [Moraxellaceae bacterium]
MKLFRAIACGLALTAAVAQAEDATAPAVDTAAPAPAVVAADPAAPAATTASVIGQPAAGKGQIVFFRPKKLMGAVFGFKVREEKQELGVMHNGTYFVLDAEPGKHSYVVHSEAKDVLTLEVEAGEVYYVQGTINMGFMAGRPNLSPSTAAAFEAEKSKLEVSSL